MTLQTLLRVRHVLDSTHRMKTIRYFDVALTQSYRKLQLRYSDDAYCHLSPIFNMKQQTHFVFLQAKTKNPILFLSFFLWF